MEACFCSIAAVAWLCLGLCVRLLVIPLALTSAARGPRQSGPMMAPAAAAATTSAAAREKRGQGMRMKTRLLVMAMVMVGLGAAG